MHTISTSTQAAAAHLYSGGVCRPIEEGCECLACKGVTRAFLHNVAAKGLPFASTLVSYHNISYMQVGACWLYSSEPESVHCCTHDCWCQTCGWLLRRAFEMGGMSQPVTVCDA